LAKDDAAAGQPRIREIRIVVEPVYSDEKAAESKWAANVNKYHPPTRDKVIRNQIVFAEGDVLDMQLLEESERKLRRFKFLNASKITVVPVDEQTVDVEVVVRDAWSLEPGINFSGGGGLAEISAHLIEFNLAGFGKKLFGEAVYENDVGTTWKAGYSDYQLFNTRWVGLARYTKGPLIESVFLSARMPLWSPDSKWSYGGTAYVADREIRLFEDGDEVSRIGKDQVQASAFLKRSLGERFKKLDLTFKVDYLKADFFALPGQTNSPLPPDQENLTPSVQADKEDIRFHKSTYIDKMGIVEDDWLGQKYGGKVGYGIPLGDGFELWDVKAFFLKHMFFRDKHALLFDTAVTSEVKRNTFVNLKARYYTKFKRHTLATHFRANFGYELDDSRQFQLGAESGLRGYPARAFTGDRLMLINLEDRQFWGEFQVGPKVALGTVVFVDAGNVWERDQSIDMSDLNWSAGVGLRIGMSNLPRQPILRIDIGWPLQGGDYAVTIGQEQQF